MLAPKKHVPGNYGRYCIDFMKSKRGDRESINSRNEMSGPKPIALYSGTDDEASIADGTYDMCNLLCPPRVSTAE